MINDDLFMQEALNLAREGAGLGEVPVGAVVVQNGVVIGRGYNQPIGQCDPTAHAEIVAMRDAAARIRAAASRIRRQSLRGPSDRTRLIGWLYPRPITTPSLTTTAPTGTSPNAAPGAPDQVLPA